jgi:cytochrome c biogenesis protein ResB
VIRRALRKAVAALTSAGLALGLLVFLTAWSAVATLVAQGDPASQEVAAWAAAHPAIEPVVAAIGFHQAFSSWLFMACAVLLGVSTALCAWKRTRSAMARSRALARARQLDAGSLAVEHDLEVALDPAMTAAEAVTTASRVLADLGVRTKRRGELLTAVSAPWTAWGSAVFHWSLVALILLVLGGNLFRSDGLMGIPVGQTLADTPVAYGLLHAGPLFNRDGVHRSFRVDAFDPDYTTGGIDRGPSPTVSVLDAAGNAVVTQRVYPNAPLKLGSLTIHAAAYGLATYFSLENTAGAVSGRSLQLVDFSQTASGGTVPVGALQISDSAGRVLVSCAITVPLQGPARNYVQSLPSNPKVRVVAVSPQGGLTVDKLVKVGETVSLPSGDVLKLDQVGYYARLSIVDDATIPFIYAGLVIAMIGLGISTLSRQQAVAATVVEGPDGSSLAVYIRLWRNAATSRAEIAAGLETALRPVKEKSDS